jgi:hypothetical protein
MEQWNLPVVHDLQRLIGNQPVTERGDEGIVVGSPVLAEQIGEADIVEGEPRGCRGQ